MAPSAEYASQTHRVCVAPASRVDLGVLDLAFAARKVEASSLHHLD